jgi:hypothetical protein
MKTLWYDLRLVKTHGYDDSIKEKEFEIQDLSWMELSNTKMQILKCKVMKSIIYIWKAWESKCKVYRYRYTSKCI